MTIWDWLKRILGYPTNPRTKPMIKENPSWRKTYGIAIVFTSSRGRRLYYRWYMTSERRAEAAKIFNDRYASDSRFSVLLIRKGAIA